jgi:hypothetical protein
MGKGSICIVLVFIAVIICAAVVASKWGEVSSARHVTFEYLPGKQIGGTVVEIFPDGTLLVAPDAIPKEWVGENPEQTSPSYFHVDPGAFLLSSSEIGKEYMAYEKEITSLPSTEWRNPPADLSARGCDFYYKSLGIAPKTDTRAIPEVTYFGYSSLWSAMRMRKLGFDNIVDRCDKVSMISKNGDVYRFALTKTSEPQEEKRHIYIEASRGEEPRVLYTAPGYFLMLTERPKNPDILFLSVNGWPGRESQNPDPRWQAVYLADINDPDNYKIVRYPLPSSSHAPKGDERLFGHSEFFSEDGKFFYALLYGFEEEGGGLWVADISRENFYENEDSFAQIFSWDHALTFLILPKLEESPYDTVIMTGKEVSDDFAMTLNALKVKFDGLKSELVEKERLARMVGWNPVPFAYKKVSDDEILVYVETYFNFESEIVPRVKNVYVVPVKLK